jgi:hypothetical protein
MKIKFPEEKVMVPICVGLVVIVLIIVAAFVVKDRDNKFSIFFFALYLGFMCAIGYRPRT